MPYKDKQQQKLAQARCYQANKELYATRLRNRRRFLKEYIDSTKVGKNCPCGETKSLDYHHTDPTKKTNTICSAGRSGWSKDRIDKEIAKCELLCRNCHRKLHVRLRTSSTEQQLRRLSIADAVNAYKKLNGCIKCKETDPSVIDFHHRKPYEKFKCISRMVTQGYGLKRIFEEIQRCDLMCANCHHQYHYG